MRCFALLCLGLSACVGHGPQRPHRTGLWTEFSAGWGRMRMSCATCDPIPEPGSAGLTRVGGTLSDRVLLGAESAIFTNTAFGGDSSIAAELETVGVVVLLFPWRSGVFLKGGVALAEGRFTIDNRTGEPDLTEGVGIGMTFGLGWDVPISRKLALTANINSGITAIGDIVLRDATGPDRRIDDVISSMLQFSLGVTFR